MVGIVRVVNLQANVSPQKTLKVRIKPVRLRPIVKVEKENIIYVWNTWEEIHW